MQNLYNFSSLSFSSDSFSQSFSTLKEQPSTAVKTSFSFGEMLDAARSEKEFTAEKTASSKIEGIEKNDDAELKPKENLSSNKEISHTKDEEKTSESDAINKKTPDTEEKIAEKTEDLENESPVKITSNEFYLASILQEQENEAKISFTDNIDFSDFAENIEENIRAEIPEVSVSEKDLSWLLKKEKVSMKDNLESLIENAAEIEEVENAEADELLKFQQLSISDPKSFLEKIENFRQEKTDISEKMFISPAVKNAAKEEISSFKKDNKITVKDYRTRTQPKIEGSEGTAVAQASKNASKNKGSMDFQFNQNQSSNNQITFDLTARNDATMNILSSNAQVAASNGSNFESLLSQSIQTNAPEFVKAGTIVLKDEGKGSINLILHPEALGNVKVNLSLNDKVLTGQITVSTQEAYNAFKENLETLKQNFAQNGFENIEFNLNFEGNNSSSQQGFAQNDSSRNETAVYNAKKTYGEFISVNPETEFSDNYNEDYGINLVA